MTLELGGKVTIECEKTKCSSELEFKLKVASSSTMPMRRPAELMHVRAKVVFLCPMQPFLGGACSVNQISGKICVGDEVVATIDGHWVRNNIYAGCICVSVSMAPAIRLVPGEIQLLFRGLFQFLSGFGCCD